MYAVWFIGFMLVFATVLWDMQKQGSAINEKAVYLACALAVGSWPALVMVCIGIWLRDRGYFDKDRQDGE